MFEKFKNIKQPRIRVCMKPSDTFVNIKIDTKKWEEIVGRAIKKIETGILERMNENAGLCKFGGFKDIFETQKLSMGCTSEYPLDVFKEKKCTCDMTLLMREGCKCGGI